MFSREQIIAADPEAFGRSHIMDIEVAQRNLVDIKGILDSVGIHFWLWFGTFLGVYREGRLIPCDVDTDLAIFIGDIPKLLSSEPLFNEKGIKLCLSCAYRRHEHTDFSVFHPHPQRRDKWIAGPLEVNKTAFEIHNTVQFLSQEWPIVSYPEKWLRYLYGENWRTPTRTPGTGMPLGADLDEVSIVVPCVNMFDTTRRCIELIAQYTPPVYELVIVADACGDEMLAWLSELESKGKAKVIRNERPVSSTKAINMGIKAADGEYISIVQSDVLVTEAWLEPLLDILKSKPEYGWVSSRVYRGDIEMKFGELQCCLLSRKMINKVGLLDEIFSQGIGYDANDYIRRLWAAGYSPHGVIKSTVYHPSKRQETMEALYGDKTHGMVEGNFGLFVNKWGSLPDETNMPIVEG